MTGEQIQATYFSPLMFFMYLFVVFVLMIVYYQWQWHKKADNFVKVIVRESDGSSTTHYAPKSGTSVTLTNPTTAMSRTWPFTDVCTIEMLYPGDGFIPVFLQKKIRTLIVDANDWEPLLNRGAYCEGVASPDVKERLREIAGTLQDSKVRTQLLSMADELKTASTREMVASPAVLGNIAKEKVSELAVTVAKDIMGPLQEAIKRLGQQVNPMVLYLGLGILAALLVYTVFQLREVSTLLEQAATSDVSKVAEDVLKIKQALGVK